MIGGFMKNFKIYYTVATITSLVLLALKVFNFCEIGWSWILLPVAAPLLLLIAAAAFAICIAICMACLFLLLK